MLSWPSSWPRKMRRRSCSASLVGREPGISQQTCSHTCDQVFKSHLIVTCPVGQISTLPGGAHQHGVFPRRSKVDVLLQHQRRTSGCVPAGLQNDNEDFIFGDQVVWQILAHQTVPNLHTLDTKTERQSFTYSSQSFARAEDEYQTGLSETWRVQRVYPGGNKVQSMLR